MNNVAAFMAMCRYGVRVNTNMRGSDSLLTGSLKGSAVESLSRVGLIISACKNFSSQVPVIEITPTASKVPLAENCHGDL